MNLVLKNRAPKSVMVLLSFVLLNACAVSKESFDCPPGKGIGCKAIHEVNQMVNTQNLAQPSETPVKPFDALASMQIPEHLQEKEVLLLQRVPQQSLKIWVAPYTDAQGHFHEASTVQAVLEPGRWQIEESF